MRFSLILLAIWMLPIPASGQLGEVNGPPFDKIDIFGVYFRKPSMVGHFNTLLRDTIKLPVEWEPFDLFGNRGICDGAVYLGNMTFELISRCDSVDKNMKQDVKFEWILFGAESIETAVLEVENRKTFHGRAYSFNIRSGNKDLTIGKQFNLDSLSTSSKINIGFWQYTPAGYAFEERTIRAETNDELKKELNESLSKNPAGITEVKEIHFTFDKRTIKKWHNLLGPSKENGWVLANGPRISFSEASSTIGVDWFTLRVRDLSKAKSYLKDIDLLSTQGNRVAIKSDRIFGLQIYLEE